MTTPNYFKKETDRIVYGNYDNTISLLTISGFAKNETWNVENIEYFETRDEDNDLVGNASFDFMVGNIRKFSLPRLLGIFTDDGTGIVTQTDVTEALDFFTLP